jgi:transcriptional regulator with XRE-family HTH domain
MNKILEARTKKGWTRRKLEEVSGISTETISKIEKHNYKAKPVIIMKLARALDIQFNDLKDSIKGMDDLLF